jgi:hypothetical protein
MPKPIQIKWLPSPEDHDYPAASSYLSLLYADAETARFVKQLKKASAASFAAKDIFRASGLSLMGVSNMHVEKDRRKIVSGEPLSPLLLVRAANNEKVVIADGYHRLCAVYSFDEDAVIPCRIV